MFSYCAPPPHPLRPPLLSLSLSFYASLSICLSCYLHKITHTSAHLHAGVCVLMQTCKCTVKETLVHVQTCAHACMHVIEISHAQAQAHVSMCTQRHTCMCTVRETYAYLFEYAHMQVNGFSLARVHSILH